MDIVDRYCAGESAPRISKELNIPVWKVYQALQRAGVSRRSNKINSRRYSFREDYFDLIDSEVKAYWLGFMCADGYVTKSSAGQKLFGVSLESKDREHLSLFKADLESTHPIKDYKSVTEYGPVSYSRLLITSEQTFDSLVNHGCGTKKSKTLAPPVIDQSLERHWLRGYFDGDGSVKIRPAARAGYSFSLVGTEGVMRWSADRIGGSVWYSKTRDVWYCDASITLKSWEYLYGDCTRYLSRKFVRAVHAKGNLSKPRAERSFI